MSTIKHVFSELNILDPVVKISSTLSLAPCVHPNSDSVDSVPDGEKQDECKEEDLNAKSCREEGYSLDEVVEDNGNKCIKTIDPASFDGKGLATVTVIPTESEFGWTLGDNERIEDIL